MDKNFSIFHRIFILLFPYSKLLYIFLLNYNIHVSKDKNKGWFNEAKNLEKN